MADDKQKQNNQQQAPQVAATTQQDTSKPQTQVTDKPQAQQAPAVEQKVVTEQSTPVQQTPQQQTTQKPQISQQQVQQPKQQVQEDQAILFELNNYLNTVKPGVVVTKEEGGKWNYTIYSLLLGILNSQDQVTFNLKWNTVLRFYNRNKDILTGYVVTRYPNQWPGSSAEFVNYRRLIFLVMETADPQKRKEALKTIKLDTLFSGMTQAQSAKLIAFYA